MAKILRRISIFGFTFVAILHIYVGSYYEGILDFNQQVDYTFTPITYEMISYHL